jgi:hypothetical protein
MKFFEEHPKLKDVVEKLANSMKAQARVFYNSEIGSHKVSDLICPPNELLINEVVINAVVDIERVRAFHTVEHPTRYKYAAYVCYWWLKAKPMYPAVHTEEEFGIAAEDVFKTVQYSLLTSVNEIFLCNFIMAMICKMDANGGDICTNYALVGDSFSDLMGSLVYFLQYRVFTAQQLEMVLKALNVCPKAFLYELS